MAHLALYRKYRPLSFREVIGQENVVSIIENQIKNKNFGHAYIFSGIRGTGKTTIAKIFARAINCEEPIGSEPCNKCETCKSIISNTSMDILEIDAASNNGVDDIREIRENVKFPPSNSKYKVYIIDEVHMLSKGAFNALLKTLEEPPEYVMFLLATTEPNKIPDTILSRCQRYNLKRVSEKEIIGRIEYILGDQNIEYENDALKLIVSKADGSVRDSLSILEKCIANKNKLTLNVANDALGLVDVTVLNNLTKAIIEKDSSEALDLINNVLDRGKDISQFVEMCINYYRNLLLVKMHKNPLRIIKITESQYKLLDKLAKKFELMQITRIIKGFIKLEKDMKWSTHKSTLLEMTIIKIINNKYDLSIDSLLERVNTLEDKIEKISIEGVNVVNNKKEEKKNLEKHTTNEKIENYIKSNSKIVIELDTVVAKWGELLKIIKKVRIKVYAFLIEGEPVSISGNKIIIKYDKEYKFHGDSIMKNKNRETVENVLEKVFMKKLSIEVTYDENINIKKENIDDGKQINEYFDDYRNVLKIKE